MAARAHRETTGATHTVGEVASTAGVCSGSDGGSGDDGGSGGEGSDEGGGGGDGGGCRTSTIDVTMPTAARPATSAIEVTSTRAEHNPHTACKRECATCVSGVKCGSPSKASR
eukprot:CAMPEP_0174713520 /NCGR_PEP_ID=MMETSP1094-20130205/14158_1 /TAXON_ID=156173 /ORGANISM="Chrysochromulina brevifilum, Strain UTEX LB 985" /LENGTH=112 /DNA_ID=CAMNT_0015912703 /DNA_START=171 /DNA_END=506 /DNA_ORIENTATION=-